MTELAFWLFYGLSAALYGVYAWKKRDTSLQALAELAVVLCLPVAGVVLLSLARCLRRFVPSEASVLTEAVPEDVNFGLGDRDYNANMVPLNDVYLLGDARMKRRFFTDSIKQDVVSNQSILRRAIQDEDREIAYYAVSLLTAKMEALGEEIHSLEEQLQTAPAEDHALMDRYAMCLKEFLTNRYGDGATRARQEQAYIRVLDVLAQKMPGRSIYYEEEIKALLAEHRIDEAAQVCRRFYRHHEQDERPILMEIRIHQARRDPQALQACIRRLKALPQALTPEALAVLRYWDEEASHE